MLHFFAHSTMLAIAFQVQIGSNVWTFGNNFFVYLIVAAIVGLVAEFLVGWRLPFGIVGAIIAGLIGVWLMTKVIILKDVGDYTISDVPIFRALIGAVILVALWHLLTYRAWSGRSRYYRGYERRRRY